MAIDIGRLGRIFSFGHSKSTTSVFGRTELRLGKVGVWLDGVHPELIDPVVTIADALACRDVHLHQVDTSESVKIHGHHR